MKRIGFVCFWIGIYLFCCSNVAMSETNNEKNSFDFKSVKSALTMDNESYELNCIFKHSIFAKDNAKESNLIHNIMLVTCSIYQTKPKNYVVATLKHAEFNPVIDGDILDADQIEKKINGVEFQTDISNKAVLLMKTKPNAPVEKDFQNMITMNLSDFNNPVFRFEAVASDDQCESTSFFPFEFEIKLVKKDNFFVYGSNSGSMVDHSMNLQVSMTRTITVEGGQAIRDLPSLNFPVMTLELYNGPNIWDCCSKN